MTFDIKFADIFEVNGNALSPERKIEEILTTIDFCNGDCINLEGTLCRSEEEFRQEINRRGNN